MDDLTILIQGPLNSISVDKIDHYLQYTDHIVFSAWSNFGELSLEALEKLKDKVTIILQPMPLIGNCACCNKRMLTAQGTSTFAWALCTTYTGLQNCNTENVLKLRSDEYYGNLGPIINLFNKERSKIVCGNIFSRVWSDRPYHIGDHIFISNTKKMLNSYKMLVAKSLLIKFSIFPAKLFSILE